VKYRPYVNPGGDRRLGSGAQGLEHVFREHPDEEITVLHVISLPESATVGEARMYIDWDELMDQKREHAEALFDEAREPAAAHDATITTETTVGRPDREILEYVEENDIDHVFVGSHGRSGVSRLLLGSVAEKVVRRAPVPVTVIR
jgi:nucleotide-binding universal stress UspA family protein